MVKIKDIAGELAINGKEVLLKAKEINLSVKNVQSSITPEEAGYLYEYITTGVDKNAKKEEVKVEEPILEKAVEKEAPKEVKEEIKKPEPKKSTTKKEIKKAIDDKPKFQIDNFRKKKEEKELELEKENNKKENQDNKKEVQVEATNKKTKPKKKTSSPKQNVGVKISFGGSGFIDHGDIYESKNNNIEIPDINIKEDVLKKYENRAKPTTTYQKYKQPAFVNPKNNNMYRKKTGINKKDPTKKRIKKVKDDTKKIIFVEENIRLYQFADKIAKSPAEVIKELFMLGEAVSKNDFLDNERLEILAEIFEIEIQVEEQKDILESKANEIKNKDSEHKDNRAPTVTIMGHVDHGKTSLLDKIRNSQITDSEAGGITQHIGAYMIEHKGNPITFIDTPGHAAFSSMRERGSQITDVVIIVVAADDGVKQQTVESIKHAKASKAPIIVAINKIDKENANIDLVKSGMAEQGLTPSDWGGDVDFIEISAKTGKGIDDLLENIILQADLIECRADKSASAKATVIESTSEKGIGIVATIILQNGHLKIKDDFVVDTTFGKIKRISDDSGKNLKIAYAGMPVKIYGLDSMPDAGSTLIGVANPKEAKEMADTLADQKRQIELSKTIKISSNDDFLSFITEGKMKNLPIVLKSDSQGTLQAITDALEGIEHEEVKVNIVSKGVGGITENDLSFSHNSSNTIIIGFNVRPTGAIKKKADNDGIVIKTYAIIYQLIDEVKNLLSGLITPIINTENTGQALVKSVFHIPKVGAVAGCVVEDGKVIKGGLCRVIRDGVVIHDSNTITSLKRFEDDVKEVKNGYECGIMINNYNKIQENDVIETYTETKETITL